MKSLIAAALLVLAAAPALAQEPALKAPILETRETRRFNAPEANQGVAVDKTHLFAIDNGKIARYDKATGAKQAEWTGDPVRFKHLNSCLMVGKELVCAGSNYPSVPQNSAVEIFDPVKMTHVRTVPLGPGIGSLTWVDRRDGFWFAMFANYDAKGGEPNRDHRWTTLVKFDDQWRRVGAWTLPETVLARMAPYSCSGGGFGDDGLLYVTGHDKPELYALKIPTEGAAVLDHVATLAIPVEGQAIVWDPYDKRVLWGVNRATRQVAAFKVPPVTDVSASRK